MRSLEVWQVPQQLAKLTRNPMKLHNKHLRNIHFSSIERNPHTYSMGRVDLTVRPIALMGMGLHPSLLLYWVTGLKVCAKES